MLDEKAIDYLEQQIPALASAAVTAAYWQTLAASLSVLEAEDGMIYEVFPDGTRKAVKAIEPGIEVVVGTKLTLR